MKPTVMIDAGVLALHFAENPRVAEYFIKIDEEKALAKREGGVLLTTDNQLGKTRK